MIFSWKRMMAIFEKDMKDLSKNIFVLSTVAMPLLVGFLFKREGDIPIGLHFLVINLAFTAVATYVQCVIIAEEKEKNTLRTLTLSPATTFDIMGGKSLVSGGLTIVTIILCAQLTGYRPENPAPIIVAGGLSLVFYIALGTMLGLLTKSVMQASVVILPFIFLFSFGTALQGLVKDTPFLRVVELLPNIQLEHLAQTVQDGGSFANIGSNLLIIAGWALVGWIAAVIAYRRQTLDV